MKRGDLIIVNLGGNVGKPRPALIIQTNILNENNQLLTTIVLPVTSELLNMEIIRYKLEPTIANGLQSTSQIMIDKIMQIEKNKVRKVIGHITKKQLVEIEARLLSILGMK